MNDGLNTTVGSLAMVSKVKKGWTRIW